MNTFLVVWGAFGTLLGLVSVCLTWPYLPPVVERRRRREQRRLAESMHLVDRSTATEVHFGPRPTRVHLVEGGGGFELLPGHVHVNWRDLPCQRPAPIEERRAAKLAEMAASTDYAGVRPAWQSETLVALEHYTVVREGADEQPALSLVCRPVDYATFAATNTALDEPFELPGGRGVTTLRHLYLPDPEAAVRRPVPHLANGLGVAVVVFSCDDQVILSRRRADANARPGELDVSVVEGLHATHDRSAAVVDPFAACRRGCDEELGLHVRPDQLSLLGFGVDLTYYQWTFFAAVASHQSAAQILDGAALHAKDRFEGSLLARPLDPRRLLELARDEQMWDLGLTALYLGLCQRIGVAGVRSAAEAAFAGPRPQRRSVSPQASA